MTPVVGAWWSVCCIEDLYPIETEEDVAGVQEWQGEAEEGMVVHLWPSLADALADPFIADMVESGDYSPKTAERLGLKP